jgi:hypothetical protein
MIQNKVGVFIDYENFNQVELFNELFDYLKNRNYFPIRRKLIMSKINSTNSLTEIVKDNYLDVVVSYKRIRSVKNRESVRYENKNNADFRFYIEALECLFIDNPDGFVIASGDKDYTELVIELKKRGKYLIGVGNRANTSEKYIALFDEFIYCEDLMQKVQSKQKELDQLIEKLVSDKLEAIKKEQAQKESDDKKQKQEALRLEKLKIKEENKRKNEELLKQKKIREEHLISEFGPLVENFLQTHKPGKYLLSTITSEIKKDHPDQFPKKIKYDIYTKLNFDVKNDSDDKSKAYLEIVKE